MRNFEVMTYSINNVAAFFKTKEKFGSYSNMASGFPITVNGLTFRSSEALYQSARFLDNPEIQSRIATEPSPVNAKRIAHENWQQHRPDWRDISVAVMEWAVRMKLAQNCKFFAPLLLSSGDMDIVEISSRDDFWGTLRAGDVLRGKNVLGKILTDIRNELTANPDELRNVKAPDRFEIVINGHKVRDFVSTVEKASNFNAMYAGQSAQELPY
jgi:ribA/ribD-fused uncharacterized protein